MPSNTRDVTGQTFCHLTALYPTDERQDGSVIWVWRCVCGMEIKRSLRNVKYGYNLGRSDCGCITPRGIRPVVECPSVGEKFGHLTIVDVDCIHRVVKCLCDCGNAVTLKIYQVVNGHRITCGDFDAHGERTRSEGLASRHQVYVLLSRYAKSIGVPFHLSEEEYHEAAQRPCKECGAVPSVAWSSQSRYNGFYKHNKVIHIDQDIGFTPDNIITLCILCSHRRRANLRHERLRTS